MEFARNQILGILLLLLLLIAILFFISKMRTDMLEIVTRYF